MVAIRVLEQVDLCSNPPSFMKFTKKARLVGSRETSFFVMVPWFWNFLPREMSLWHLPSFSLVYMRFLLPPFGLCPFCFVPCQTHHCHHSHFRLWASDLPHTCAFSTALCSLWCKILLVLMRMMRMEERSINGYYPLITIWNSQMLSSILSLKTRFGGQRTGEGSCAPSLPCGHPGSMRHWLVSSLETGCWISRALSQI